VAIVRLCRGSSDSAEVIGEPAAEGRRTTPGRPRTAPFPSFAGEDPARSGSGIRVGWSRPASALPCPAGRSVPGREGPERRRVRDRTGPILRGSSYALVMRPSDTDRNSVGQLSVNRGKAQVERLARSQMDPWIGTRMTHTPAAPRHEPGQQARPRPESADIAAEAARWPWCGRISAVAVVRLPDADPPGTMAYDP
jgi:hypothetical protein